MPVQTVSLRKISGRKRSPLAGSLLLASLILGGALRLQPARADVPRDPYQQDVTKNSAVIVWKTANALNGRAWLTGPDGTRFSASGGPGTFHKAFFTGLTIGTEYKYAVNQAPGKLFSSTLHTAPSSTAPHVTFAVWGDSGMGNDGQKAVAAQIEKFHPDFLVHTGDLIYPEGQGELLDPRFFQIYQPTLSKVSFWGALGNHDVMTQDGRPWLDNFVLPHNGPAGEDPGREYSFNWGPAHFAVLDSDASVGEMKNIIAPWLEKDLKASHATWKFVVFHHPPYTEGLHGDSDRTKPLLVPAIEAGGANVVLNGHDHDYERFVPINGITYIVTGEGGGPLYPRKTHRPICAIFDNKHFSFTAISLDGNKLHLKQIAGGGQILDDWTITK